MYEPLKGHICKEGTDSMFYASLFLITVLSVSFKRADEVEVTSLEVDKVLLSRKLSIVSTTLDKLHHGLILIGIKLIRVNVIRVDFVILFFFTGYILLVLVLTIGRRLCSSSGFSKLSCAVNMGQGAFLLFADPRVGIIRAFIDMSISAFCALFAISQYCKIAADGCSRRDADMCVATFRV